MVTLCTKAHYIVLQKTKQTIESVEAPNLILCNSLPACQCSVQVHQGLRILGMHETKGMSNLMSCHMDQICEPHPCGRKHDIFVMSVHILSNLTGLLSFLSQNKPIGFHNMLLVTLYMYICTTLNKHIVNKHNCKLQLKGKSHVQ